VYYESFVNEREAARAYNLQIVKYHKDPKLNIFDAADNVDMQVDVASAKRKQQTTCNDETAKMARLNK